MNTENMETKKEKQPKQYNVPKVHLLNKERGGIMQDRHLGQAIIVIGCLLMLTQLISPVIAVAFILSGLSQL